MRLALGQAKQLGHHWLGCEHLLLGLLADEQGAVARVLSGHGVTLEAARQETVRIVGPPGEPDPDAGLTFTPRATVVSRLAEVEAERLGELEPRPAHILLALMTEGGSVALHVLSRLGVDLVQLRAELLDALQVPKERCERYIREREAYVRARGGEGQ
jgi:ATP-dependent Clp protease ATP-binding subunit ClpC